MLTEVTAHHNGKPGVTFTLQIGNTITDRLTVQSMNTLHAVIERALLEHQKARVR